MLTSTKLEKSWFLALFGLPFFLIGAGFLVLSIIPSCYDAWRMSSWQFTQARLLEARLVSQRGSEGGATFSVAARYVYEVNGQHYQNSRVSINEKADNIGEFQEQLGYRLQQSWQQGQPVAAWYDPAHPEDAILNRDLRWGLLAVKSIFVIIFGGVGFFLIFSGLRGVPPTPALSADAGQSWLNNPDWRYNVIRYKGKTTVYVYWLFSLLIGVGSIPALLNFMDIWQKKGNIALLIFLFPLLGVVMLYQSIKKTLEWWRFGDTPLRLDPFPGAIGGDVGGEIFLKSMFDTKADFDINLSCIYSYISGTGEDRSRSEKLVWHDSTQGYAQNAIDGTRLQFRFAVPEGLPPSETQDENYHLWRLSIHGKLRGVDLERQFEIPVYPGEKKSSLMGGLGINQAAQTSPVNRIEKLLPFRTTGYQSELYYRPFRKVGEALGILLIGVIFGGSGAFLWQQAADGGLLSVVGYTMSVVFSLIGFIILCCGIYDLFNALYVICDGQQVTSTRRFLGIKLSQKSAPYLAIKEVNIVNKGSSQVGGQHLAKYEVHAITVADKITLAEQIDAFSKAEVVADYFRGVFGLKTDH